MKVLGIGYGRHVFDSRTFEHKRLQQCAGEVESFDLIIFTLQKEGFSVLEAPNNFTVHPTNSKNKLLMLYDAIKIGNRIVKSKKSTVITTQDLFETGLVGFVLKLLHSQVALQVQEHGDVLSSVHWRRESVMNRLRYWFALFIVRRADVIRVVSERTRVFLQDELKLHKKINTFPVVIDLDNFKVPEFSEKNESSKLFTFVTAARFVPQKNFPLMLDAFAAAYKQNENIRLKIFGEGVQKQAIEKQIQVLGLIDVVELHGWTNELGLEICKADAYVLSSNYEGWARVLIEAMVLGVPTVTTDVGCVGEVLIHDQHGLVVPVGDQAKLAAAMHTIASDKKVYTKIQNQLSTLNVKDIPGTTVETYARDWALTLQ